MNIIFYIDVLGGGGAERVITVIANNLLNYGHNITLVANHPYYSEYYIDKRINRVYLSDTEIKGKYLSKNLSRVKSLKKILIENSADCLVSFLWGQNIRALIASHGCDCNNVISVRNDPKNDMSLVKKVLAKILFKRATYCVFQTKSAQEYFPELDGKSEIIPNPIDDSFFENTYDPDSHRILVVGRLVEQKNHRLAVDAFKLSGLFDCGYTLHFYGDGQLRDEIKAHIKELGLEESVTLHERSECIQDEYRDTAFLVSSSNYEGMPNVVSEAMASGLPVVGTDCPCGGTKVLLDNGSAGVLVAVGDVNAMALAMKTLASDRQKRLGISDRARARARQFSTDIIVKRWNDLIVALSRSSE